jgi:hypothetical protein
MFIYVVGCTVMKLKAVVSPQKNMLVLFTTQGRLYLLFLYIIQLLHNWIYLTVLGFISVLHLVADLWRCEVGGQSLSHGDDGSAESLGFLTFLCGGSDSIWRSVIMPNCQTVMDSFWLAAYSDLRSHRNGLPWLNLGLRQQGWLWINTAMSCSEEQRKDQDWPLEGLEEDKAGGRSNAKCKTQLGLIVKSPAN